jgi:hypothetical protein
MKIESCTITNGYPNDMPIEEALALFANSLFKEGFINISIKHNDETNELYKELSIKASRVVLDT